MRVTYEMDKGRMKQLLSFDHNYKKNVNRISEEELLEDFTSIYLHKLGMKIIKEEEHTEPEEITKEMVHNTLSNIQNSDSDKQEQITEVKNKPISNEPAIKEEIKSTISLRDEVNNNPSMEDNKIQTIMTGIALDCASTPTSVSEETTDVVQTEIKEEPQETPETEQEENKEIPIENDNETKEEVIEEQQQDENYINYDLLTTKLKELNNSRDLKVDIGSLNLMLNITCKTVKIEDIKITNEDYDKYYAQKRINRNNGDYSGTGALVGLIKDLMDREPDKLRTFIKDIYALSDVPQEDNEE